MRSHDPAVARQTHQYLEQLAFPVQLSRDGVARAHQIIPLQIIEQVVEFEAHRLILWQRLQLVMARAIHFSCAS